jgi:hypothetical protein
VLEVIIGLGTVLLLVMLTLQYTSKSPAWLKAVSIFAITGFYVAIYEHYLEYRATPIADYPNKKFVYVHHVNDAHNRTLLWAYHHQTNQHRLYVFPYTRENAKKLQRAQQGTAQGQQSEITVIENSNTDAPGLELDLWQGPKNAVEK